MAKKENEVVEEFNLDKKVTVNSIALWSVGFRRINGIGDVVIGAKGSVRLSREEIQAQVDNNNRLFVGSGNGKHATLYIDDAETRKYLEFDTDDKAQKVLTKNVAIETFKIADYNQFVEKVNDICKTRAEKQTLLKYAEELKLNEYDKMSYLRDYCALRFVDRK